MRFACDQCSTKFMIADDKVRGRVVAIRCTKCGYRITVNGHDLVAPEPVAEERTRILSVESVRQAAAAAPAASLRVAQPLVEPLADGWYAMQRGQQAGPLSADEMLARIRAGQVGPRTHVWIDGQADWRRAADVAEIARHLAKVPAAAPVVPARPAAPAAPSRVDPFSRVGAPQADAPGGEAVTKFMKQPDVEALARMLGEPADAGQSRPAAPAAPSRVDAPQAAAPGGEAVTRFMKQPDVEALARMLGKASDAGESRPEQGALPFDEAPARSAAVAAAPEDPGVGAYEDVNLDLTPAPAALSALAAAVAAPGAGGAYDDINLDLTPAPGVSSSGAAAAEPAPKGNRALSRELFEGEFDNMATMIGRPLDLGEPVGRHSAAGPTPAPGAGAAPGVRGAPAAGASSPDVDPFAGVRDSAPAVAPMVIGEQTRFFMNQAGVNRRNPPWKIALFFLCLVGGPAAILFLLTRLHVTEFQVVSVDEATGQQVTRSVSVFSSAGMSGLRDRLLKTAPPPEAASVARPRGVKAPPKETAPKAAVAAADEGPVVARPSIEFKRMDADSIEKAKKMWDERGPSNAPKLRAGLEDSPKLDGAAVLDAQAVSETIAKNMKAIQACTEDELRRNPAFPGGKVTLVLTLGPSGVVTRARVDNPQIDGSTLGACLRDRAKRIAFPSFQGDEPVDVEMPLVLSRGF